jgi:uncharacterized membrane protein YphA (DoxX/SURF4 family)
MVEAMRSRLVNTPYALWIVQGLLALVFLSAGATKLAMSSGELAENYPMPADFMRFIGVAELFGAPALILPGVLRVRRGLTPLAAAGLTIIMTGATVLTLADGEVGPALIPLVLGVLLAFVVYSRRSWLTGDLGRSSLASRRITTTSASDTR